jgi:hypothetical protein
MMPVLQYSGSRAGRFYGLSAGELCPLRILACSFGAVELRFPPLISRETTKPSRHVFQKRHHHLYSGHDSYFSKFLKRRGTVSDYLSRIGYRR